jgi:hypothetical protein
MEDYHMNNIQSMVPAFNMDHTKKLHSKCIVTWLTESTCSDMVYGWEMYTCKPNSKLEGGNTEMRHYPLCQSPDLLIFKYMTA